LPESLPSVTLSMVPLGTGRRDALGAGLFAWFVGCGSVVAPDGLPEASDSASASASLDATVTPLDATTAPVEGTTADAAELDSGSAPDGGVAAAIADGPLDAGFRPDAATVCPAGSVTFRLLPGTNSEWWFQWPCSFGSWLGIRDAAGNDLALATGCPFYSCNGCGQDPPCSFGCAASLLPDSGTDQVWDGTYWVAHETCNAAWPPGDGSGTPVQCGRWQCALPGRYDAVMCVSPTSDGAAPTNAKSACIDVPFDYPASGPVIGTLP
jgi:hypothetical protein